MCTVEICGEVVEYNKGLRGKKKAMKSGDLFIQMLYKYIYMYTYKYINIINTIYIYYI